MPKYLVELKRVVFCTVRVEAPSRREARELVGECPADWLSSADILGTDDVSIISVKAEPHEG